MVAASNPTQLTPPRVAFIDERTGAISREWYRFFLSLLTATESNQDISDLTPDASSLLAAFDSRIDALTQSVETAPRAELGTMAALQQANLPWIKFDTTPSGFPTGPAANGTVYWDDADGIKTLNLVMEDSGGVIQQIGEETYYRVKATANITSGQVVMFTGTVGASGGLKGAPATGLTATQSEYIMGVATMDIPNNAWGYVTWFGLVRGINTTGSLYGETWADGDILYYNPAVAGGLTKTVPAAPNPKVIVGAVIYASASNGSLFIRPTFGSAFGATDSNVQITGLANNDIIQYYATGGYWRNVTTLNVAAGGTGANSFTAGYALLGNGTGALTSSGIYQDSGGKILLGTTTAVGANVQNEFKITTAGTWPLALNANDRGLLVRNSASTSGYYAYFEYNGGTNNGSISWSGSTTSYNTTSDQRIKTNIVPAPDAGDLIDAIEVRSWDFTENGQHWRYGMVAQELLPIVPEAVSIPPDPDTMMMGIDYSKLVPLLIKEVQSLRRRVAKLEAS